MSGIVESSYYREPKGETKGNKPPETTCYKEKGFVSQETVVSSVKEILSHEFINYGYRLMTSHLQREGYTIKQKQVIAILSALLDQYSHPENIVIRSDDVSKFIAKKVRE